MASGNSPPDKPDKDFDATAFLQDFRNSVSKKFNTVEQRRALKDRYRFTFQIDDEEDPNPNFGGVPRRLSRFSFLPSYQPEFEDSESEKDFFEACEDLYELIDTASEETVTHPSAKMSDEQKQPPVQEPVTEEQNADGNSAPEGAVGGALPAEGAVGGAPRQIPSFRPARPPPPQFAAAHSGATQKNLEQETKTEVINIFNYAIDEINAQQTLLTLQLPALELPYQADIGQIVFRCHETLLDKIEILENCSSMAKLQFGYTELEEHCLVTIPEINGLVAMCDKYLRKDPTFTQARPSRSSKQKDAEKERELPPGAWGPHFAPGSPPKVEITHPKFMSAFQQGFQRPNPQFPQANPNFQGTAFSGQAHLPSRAQPNPHFAQGNMNPNFVRPNTFSADPSHSRSHTQPQGRNPNFANVPGSTRRPTFATHFTPQVDSNNGPPRRPPFQPNYANMQGNLQPQNLQQMASPDIKKFYKPSVLLHTASISEFRNWKQKYNCFHYMSNLHECTPLMQFSSIILLVDEVLEDEIRANSFQQTVTFNPNDDQPMENEAIPSHMQILSHYFNDENPAHVRRAQVLDLRNKPGAKDSDFVRNYQQQVINADVHFVTAEEIFAQSCIQQLNSPVLRRELMAQPFVPNFKQIHAYVKRHEANAAKYKESSNASTNSSVNVQTTTQNNQSSNNSSSNRGGGGRGRGRGGNRGGRGGTSSATSTPGTPNSRPPSSSSTPRSPPTDGSFLGCWRCGDLKHYPSDCVFKNRKCNKCQLLGHNASKCVKKTVAKTNIFSESGNNDASSGELPSVQM